MERKKIPIGIKLISIILIVPSLATLLVLFITSTSKAALMSPDSKKIEIMQSAVWKGSNITTIEQFDAHVKKAIITSNNSDLIWRIFTCLITLTLSIALWKLKSWSRIGTIVYSCFTILTKILWFEQLGKAPPFLFAQFLSIVTFVAVIYYLTRPNIKEIYAKKSKTGLS